MADQIQELKRNKEELCGIKSDIERSEGQKEQILSQLKETFDIESIDDAKAMIEVLTNELKTNDTKATELNATMAEIITKAKQQ